MVNWSRSRLSCSGQFAPLKLSGGATDDSVFASFFCVRIKMNFWHWQCQWVIGLPWCECPSINEVCLFFCTSLWQCHDVLAENENSRWEKPLVVQTRGPLLWMQPCLNEQAPGSRIWGLLAIFRGGEGFGEGLMTEGWVVTSTHLKQPTVSAKARLYPVKAEGRQQYQQELLFVANIPGLSVKFLSSVVPVKGWCSMALTPWATVLEDGVLLPSGGPMPCPTPC